MTKAVKLIITDELIRGTGQDHDPRRRIVKLITLDGDVVVQWDPDELVSNELVSKINGDVLQKLLL